MSDDRLFRWNLKIHLTCVKCNGTHFVEEVASEEIFCASCGTVFARNRQEWPSDWGKDSFFGTLASEQSWNESLQPRRASKSPEYMFIRSSTPLADGSPSSGDTSRSTSPYERTVLQRRARQPDKAELVTFSKHDQIEGTSANKTEFELVDLSHDLGLSEEVVAAAKRILSLVESQKYDKRGFASYSARVALFAACRQLSIPKTFNEFEIGLDKYQKSHFHKHFIAVNSILKEVAVTSPTNPLLCTGGLKGSSFPTIFSVQDFINSEAKAMELSDAIRLRALEISKHPQIDNLFSGKRPTSIAAIILSYAAECESVYIGAKPYADAANITLQTVLQGQKLLSKFLKTWIAKKSLPPDFHPPHMR